MTLRSSIPYETTVMCRPVAVCAIPPPQPFPQQLSCSGARLTDLRSRLSGVVLQLGGGRVDLACNTVPPPPAPPDPPAPAPDPPAPAPAPEPAAAAAAAAAAEDPDSAGTSAGNSAAPTRHLRSRALLQQPQSTGNSPADSSSASSADTTTADPSSSLSPPPPPPSCLFGQQLPPPGASYIAVSLRLAAADAWSGNVSAAAAALGALGGGALAARLADTLVGWRAAGRAALAGLCLPAAADMTVVTEVRAGGGE